MQTTYEIFEASQISPPWALVFVVGLDLAALALVIFCIVEIRKAKRAAAAAASAVNPGVALFEGARFVAGKVELAQGEPSAVRVTVTQKGTERAPKGIWSHCWTETARETSARPFYLVHESGARIRVEPPLDVMLVDGLDQKEWLERTERRLRAELAPGELAVVEGFLQRGEDPEAADGKVGYRQAARQGWIMKPIRRGKMHISTEALSRRHLLRARAFRYALAWMIAAALGGQVPLRTYYLRVFFGKDVEAEYTGKFAVETKGGARAARSAWGYPRSELYCRRTASPAATDTSAGARSSRFSCSSLVQCSP